MYRERIAHTLILVSAVHLDPSSFSFAALSAFLLLLMVSLLLHCLANPFYHLLVRATVVLNLYRVNCCHHYRHWSYHFHHNHAAIVQYNSLDWLLVVIFAVVASSSFDEHYDRDAVVDVTAAAVDVVDEVTSIVDHCNTLGSTFEYQNHFDLDKFAANQDSTDYIDSDRLRCPYYCGRQRFEAFDIDADPYLNSNVNATDVAVVDPYEYCVNFAVDLPMKY